jgi:iron complex outermembrane receptor protein
MTNTSAYRSKLIPGKNRKKILAKAVSASIVASAMATPVWSQTLEEVIVSATKRNESTQDVALAITALSGDFINKVNLSDVKDLVSFTPGVTGNSQDSFIDAISVRGIRTQDFGIGLDPSAAFFKNDLYEGRNGSAVTTLYDLDRAEVLRGPQGFLFGRNSIGGAFSVHTKQAEIGSSDGYFEAELGERGIAGGEGAINIPVGDNMAARVAGFYSTEDGFVDNLNGGPDLIEHENWGLRFSTAFETDKLGVRFTAEYEDRTQSGSVYRAVTEGEVWETLEAALGPIDVAGTNEDIDVDRSGGDNDDGEILAFGLHIDYDLGFAALTSNTGYKDHDYYYNEDYDGTALNLETYRQDQTGEYFQQEVRLVSQTDGPLSWYAGASYYKEDLTTDYRFAGEEDFFCQYYGYYYNSGMTFSGCADLYNYYGSEFTASANGLLEETARIEGEYEGWGAYVNVAYAITETFELEAGVRYTDDEKKFTTNVPTPISELGPYWAFGFSTAEPISDTQSWDDWTPRVIAKWSPTDTALVFASYTAGFKSGGFGTFSLTDNAAGEPATGNLDIVNGQGFTPDPVDPETVDSFEIGYKDTFFDGNTNLDLTAYYYDYTDFQVTVGTESGAALIENVGTIEAWGAEGSITTKLSENLTAYINVGYLDSEATDIQDACGLEDVNGCEGSRIFWAPEWSGSVVLNASFPMEAGALSYNLEMVWESERGGGWEGLAETEIDSYEELALRVAYESQDSWFVEAYVENLTNEFTWDGQNNLGGKEPHAFFGPRRPRTFGLRTGYVWD